MTRNYVHRLMTRYYVRRDWKVAADERLFTAFCDLPGSPRGSYDEEIDVAVGGYGQANLAEVRRVVERELSEHYAPELQVRRIVRRW